MKLKAVSLLALCGFVGNGWGVLLGLEDGIEFVERVTINVAHNAETINFKDPLVYGCAGQAVIGDLSSTGSWPFSTENLGDGFQSKTTIGNMDFRITPDDYRAKFLEGNPRDNCFCGVYSLSQIAQSTKYGTPEIEAAWKVVFEKFAAEDATKAENH